MIVGLFPELLAPGGVQRAGRHIAAVLAQFADETRQPVRLLSLKDPAGANEFRLGGRRVGFWGAGGSKARFVVKALRGVLLSNREQSSAKSQGSRQVPDAPPNSRDEGRLIWHRIPTVPGPHIFNYAWWFFANHLWRRWACWFRGVRYDLVYSPGINCLDADAIPVHIVFHEFEHHVRGELKLSKVPIRAWPRALHRRIYYRLIRALERRIYPRQCIRLAAVSGLTARELDSQCH